MITVAGLAPSVDLTYLVDQLELGRIHRPTDAVRCAGGKPLNMARAAAALGADVGLVAVLGGWTGDCLAASSGGRRSPSTVTTPALTRTCVSISLRDSDKLTEIYEYAEPIPADVWADLTAAVAAAGRRPGWLVISGGPPRGLAPTALAELAGLGTRPGCRVAADTHGPSLARCCDAGPDW